MRGGLYSRYVLPRPAPRLRRLVRLARMAGYQNSTFMVLHVVLSYWILLYFFKISYHMFNIGIRDFFLIIINNFWQSRF